MMRRSHRHALVAATVAGLALAGWAYAHQPVWLPTATAWAQQAWRKATRPDDATLPQGRAATRAAESREAAAGTSVTHARKCVKDGVVSYTDQACPSGSQERWVDADAGALVRVERAAPPAR